MAQAIFDDNSGQGNQVGETAAGPASMEEVLEMLEENEHTLGKPPEDFNMEMFLLASKGQTLPGNEVNFGSYKNGAVDSAIENIDKFFAFIQIVWYKIVLLLQKHFKKNIQKGVKRPLPTIC